MKLSNRQFGVFIVAALGSHCAVADELININDAWIAEAPPVSRVLAAYMEIDNESPADRRAIAMQCAEFERAEFHRSFEKQGVAGMEHLKALEIPAKAGLELKPGDLHIMLFNPERRLRVGDKTDCSMEFDDGTVISFELEIKKASPEDHSHHHH